MAYSLRESRPSWRRPGGRREVAGLTLHLQSGRREREKERVGEEERGATSRPTTAGRPHEPMGDISGRA